MSLGQTICRLRSQKGLSQSQLADQLGVSRQSVSKWETDASAPDLDNLVKLHELFGVTMDQLILDEAASPQTEPAVPAPVCPQAVPARILVCLLLFGIGALALVLCTLQGDPVAGLILAVPFFIPALICIYAKKRWALWCGWSVYGTLYLAAVMFTRFSSSLFFWKFMARWITRPGASWQMYQTYWFDLLVAALAFAAFAFLAACTLRSFRSLQIAADHARRGIAAGCAAYLVLLFPLPPALANAGFGILPGLLALLRMAVLVDILVYGAALYRTGKTA